MIKAVLFDLDDTLISEDQYIRSGYRHISKIFAKRYGVVIEQTEKELYHFYLENGKNVFNRFLEVKGIPYTPSDIREFVGEYRNHIPKITYYEDVMPTISKLKQKGIPIGIISDGYLSTQKKKSDVLGLYDTFEKVIFTDELGKEYWKPSIKAFEIMREFFDIEYNEMMYVGDNPAKDFYVKELLSINTVRIYRDNAVYKNTAYLNAVEEDIKIKNLTELLYLV